MLCLGLGLMALVGLMSYRSDLHLASQNLTDATQWITEAAAAGQRADVIFMDPPREGSTPQFIESVARMAPKRVVYVSCNPETMARDLALLTEKGYRAEGFTPVDLFPQTAHCEVVGSLTRSQKSKG